MEEEGEGGILELQAVFMASLAIVTGLAYFVPLWLLLRKKISLPTSDTESGFHCISLTNSLSCGILLGTCFLGMWPAAESKWAEALAWPSSTGEEGMKMRQREGRSGEQMRSETPWHNLTVLVGFCAIFSLQQILTNAWGSSSYSPGRTDDADDADEVEVEEEEEVVDPFSEEKVMLHEAAEVMERRGKRRRDRGRRETGSSNRRQQQPQQPHCSVGLGEAASNMTFFETMCLVLVVSWHTVLEGLTLGVQTDPATAKALFVGIASHTMLMASAVTLVAGPAWMAMGWSTSKMCMVLFLMVLTRPMGMAVGVTIGEVGASSHGWLLASAALQSLSVGLFLHLIFIGIIPSEFKRAPRGTGTAGALFMLCMRLGLMVLGWISFLLLMMAFGHKHH